MHSKSDIDYVMALAAQKRYQDAFVKAKDLLVQSNFQDGSVITLCLYLLDMDKRVTDAIDILTRICSVNFLPKWSIVLAERYRSIGDTKKALATIELVLREDPENLVALAHKACWQGSILGDSRETRQLFEDWGTRFEAQFPPCVNDFPLIERSFNRKLRIGYISGDFKNHSVRYFIEGYFRHHNRDEFEVHAYMTLPGDQISSYLRELVDYWHDVQELNDKALHERIRSAGIDILVDLSGHTKGERLAVFAMRAAPIQLTWFAFMQTLGLKCIDWRLTDYGATPYGSESFYTENLYRLNTMVTYTPPLNSEGLFESPWHKNGFLTLICLNDSRKFSDLCLSTWATILENHANAGLILISRDKDSQLEQNALHARLDQFGFPMERISIIERQTMTSFMRLSSVADLALDSFPISGGTTTLHALWMGLPTVTIRMNSGGAINNSTAGILEACSFHDCVASSPETYIELVSELITHREKIDILRDRCRENLKNSPLMNYDARVSELEYAYKEMWIQYLNS